VTKRRIACLGLALAVLAVPLLASSIAAEQAKGPRIAAEPVAFDFGKALQRKTLHKDFVIKNLGTEDLLIEKVSTTCGCTAALMDDDAKLVKPGRTAVLRVSLETRNYTGKVERKVLVQSNDPVRNPLEVRVQATVVAGE
jgi:hypothetical protein